MNAKRFIKYVGESITSGEKQYPVSLWFDDTKERFFWRITSLTTGKVVRTFTTYRELLEYRVDQRLNQKTT